MAIIPHSGSSRQILRPKNEKSNIDENSDAYGITTSKNKPPPSKIDESFIEDAAKVKFTLDDPIEQMAYDTTYFNNSVYDDISGGHLKNLLLGFLKGIRVTTTYYWRQNGASTRTNVADSATEIHSVNTPTVKILNYEITLVDQLDTSISENGDLLVTGSAVLYPRFRPCIGDRFILGLGDNRFAIFTVDKIDVRSYQDDRLYIILFSMYGYAEQSEIEAMEAAVTETKVFSKAFYLAGESTLLSSEVYIQRKKISSYIPILTQYYHSIFYDSDAQTYLCEEYGYYDPYLIEFITRLFQFEHVPVKPRQWVSIDDFKFKSSIFGNMLSSIKFGIYSIYTCGMLREYKSNALSPFISSITDRMLFIDIYKMIDDMDGCEDSKSLLGWGTRKIPYLRHNDIKNNNYTTIGGIQSIAAGKDITYVFSKDFYNSKLGHTSDSFEKLVYKTICLRKNESTEELLNTIDKFTKLPRAAAFYHIPIYIWLCHITLDSLQATAPSSY